ncbi:HNH endonuclease signature motif containing protein [Microbacterium esteraromaticum]|uniref:HNH endonuclease n=1 Tax=Microbacterium esteraromaticum TaxID=57043 RepID=UPI00309B36DC
MIGQRPVKLTPKQEKYAYAAATARDKGRCQRCGSHGVTHRDHRQNRDAYNTTPANLQLLCVECHQWKTDNHVAAILEGFAVSRWSRPQVWPAWRIDVGWVQYFDTPDADGNWWQRISQATADLLMNGGTDAVVQG